MSDRTTDSLQLLETATRSAVLSREQPRDDLARLPGLTTAAHPDLGHIGERVEPGPA